MEININRVLEICNDFLKVPSSIDAEKPFLDFLNKKVKKLGYETILKEDYLVVKPRNQIKCKYLFSAHIDRHSIIKNDEGEIEHLGFYLKKKLKLKFKRERIEKFEKEIVSKLSKQFGEDNIILDERFLKFRNIIGKKTIKFEREEGDLFYTTFASRFVNLDVSSYDKNTGEIFKDYKILRSEVDVNKRYVEFHLNKEINGNEKYFMLKSEINILKNKFFGQIDNVISVATLFYLLEKKDFSQEIIFTTKEEIGQSWKNLIDYNSDLKIISLDTSPYPSFKNKELGFLTFRRGDENGMFDEDLVEKLIFNANEQKIPYHFKPYDFGQTELGNAITNSNEKINGVTLQLPTMNYHTTYETSTLESLENYIKLIEKLSK